MNDLHSSELITNHKSTAAELYDQYHSTVTSLVNKHAPCRNVTCADKPANPWMTPDIHEAKRIKRQLERRWRRSKLPSDRARFNRQVHLCNRLLNKSKHNYYSDIISENQHDPQKLWNSVSNILHHKPEMIYLDYPDTC